MARLPATAAGTWLFDRVATFLTERLTRTQERGDVANEVLRRTFLGNILELKYSLSAMSQKELQTARFQLNNGLLLSQQDLLEHARSEFEAARRNAELAFSAVIEVDAKIDATQMAVMAVLYQYDDDLGVAYTLCMQYLRRLHDLQELKETVRVHLFEARPMTLNEAAQWLVHFYWLPRGNAWPVIRDGGRFVKSIKDWVTRTDRKAVFESVVRLNLILCVFFLKNNIITDLTEWPAIDMDVHDPVQPLTYILSFDRTNHHTVKSGDPTWDIELLEGDQEGRVVCLCKRARGPLELVQMDLATMKQVSFLQLKFWPCVLHAANKDWLAVVGQREGTCQILVLNRQSWRFDREKEIADQANNNDQLVRVLQVALDGDTLFLLQRNGTISHIHIPTMALTKTVNLNLEKISQHPYAHSLNFDEPLDEYELSFLQRTDKVKLAKEQTALNSSHLLVAKGALVKYNIRTGEEMLNRQCTRLEEGQDAVIASSFGYLCLMYIDTNEDQDLLKTRPGCDVEIRDLDTLEIIATKKMPYFRQSRHLVVAREGDFLAVLASRTVSLWEMNSGTLLDLYTFTSLEPVDLQWANGRFLLTSFTGGDVCKYEIMN